MYEIRNRKTGKVIAKCPTSENARKLFKERYLDADTHGIFKIKEQS